MSKPYVYARIRLDDQAGTAAVSRLNGGAVERTGKVTKTAPYAYLAEREGGSRREFKAAGRVVVNEPELFNEAARWSVGGFDCAMEWLRLPAPSEVA